mgnify:CR=1 FL=1
MHRHPNRVLSTAAFVALAAACPAVAIEMFTYFGDGSRIGLPSLEVPVQAYPGIPLRSDRIRARARANQVRRAATAGDTAGRPSVDGDVTPPPIPGGGIRIRPMPGDRLPGTGSAWPSPPPAATVPSQSPSSQSPSVVPSTTSRAGQNVTAPAPEGVARPGEKTLPGLTRPLFPARP